MSILLTFLAEKLAGRILYNLTDELVDKFIGETNPTSDDVIESQDFESRLVEWLNEQVDIPFVSEQVEEDVLRLVVHGVKSMVLMRLK